MTDIVHYLVHKIMTAWRENKVVSVLYLDVKGTFPNTVPARLIYNFKKRQIPASIVNFVKLLLSTERLDSSLTNYISVIITVINGIRQGDLLSMILYILYNTDLLRHTK